MKPRNRAMEMVGSFTTLFCTVCKGEIPEKRIRRGASTCSPECRKVHRKIQAARRAKSICKYCGARKRSKILPAALELGSTQVNATVEGD